MPGELKPISPAALDAFIQHPQFSLHSLNDEMRHKPFGEQFCKDFFRSPQSYKVNGTSLVDYVAGLSQVDLLSFLNRIAPPISITLENLCTEASAKPSEGEKFAACLRNWDHALPSDKAHFFADFLGANGILKSFFEKGSSQEVNLAYDAARGAIAEQWLSVCCPGGVDPHQAMQDIMCFHSQFTLGLGTLVMDLFFSDLSQRLQAAAMSFASIDPMHSRFVDLSYRDEVWHYTISDQLGALGESPFLIAHTLCDLLVTPHGFVLHAMQYDHERLVAALDYPSVETQCALLVALLFDCPGGEAKGSLLQVLLEQSFQDMPEVPSDTQARLHAIALDVLKLSIPRMQSIQELTGQIKTVFDSAGQNIMVAGAMRAITEIYLEKLSSITSLKPVDANEACAVLGQLLRLHANEILFFRILTVLLDIAEQQQGIRFHPAVVAMHVAFSHQPSQIDFYLMFLEQLKQHTISAFRTGVVRAFLNEANPLSVQKGFSTLVDMILRAALHEDVSEALCRVCVLSAKANGLEHVHKEVLYFHHKLNHECMAFTAKDLRSGVPLFSVGTIQEKFLKVFEEVLPTSASASRSLFSKLPIVENIVNAPDKVPYVNQACYFVRKAQIKSLLPYVSLQDAAHMFFELGAMQQMIHFDDPALSILQRANTLEALGGLYDRTAYQFSLHASEVEKEKIMRLDATGLSGAEKMVSLLTIALCHSNETMIAALREVMRESDSRLAM